MKIKVFEPNRYGKIEFTRAELEKLLNEVYTDGYKEGEYDARSRSWTWTSPYVSTYGTSITNKVSTDPSVTLTSANCATDKIEAVLDNSVATACNNADAKTYTVDTADKAPAYSVKVNGSISSADLSKLVNDIFAAGASRNTPKKVEDAFDKLAKELSF